jgi:hypothetical protein
MGMPMLGFHWVNSENWMRAGEFHGTTVSWIARREIPNKKVTNEIHL